MQKLTSLRFLVLSLVIFMLLSFLSVSSVSAKETTIHGSNLFSAPHTVITSSSFPINVTPDEPFHPTTGICTYIVYAPFIGTVNGINYIIAQGGYTCNTTFASASLVVTLNGPTTSSGAIFSHLFTCSLQSSCAGWIGWPYQSGGMWQTVVNGGSASVGFTGQPYSTWASL